MRNVLKIAFRNTRRQKKRSFLLGGAIAFGIMVITLLNAFTTGLTESVKENFSQILGGHIFITGTKVTDTGKLVTVIEDSSVVDAAIKEIEDQIVEVNRRSMTFAEVIFGSKTVMQRIDGVDYGAETDMLDGLDVVDGSLEHASSEDSLILPVSVAERLNVVPGETVLVRLTTVTGQQNVGEFRVIATIGDQTSFGLSSAYANLSYLNELLGLPGPGNQLYHILVKRMESMDSVADVLHASIAERAPVEPRNARADAVADSDEDDDRGFSHSFRISVGRDEEVEPWEGTKYSVTTLNDLMEPVMDMVGVLDTVGLVIFVMLLVITMVGIVNTFRMVMLERTKEIGTMRAFGMQRGTIRSMFLLEALFIAVGGALAGLVVSAVIMAIVGSVSISDAPVLQFLTRNGKFVFVVTARDLATNLLILTFLTLLAAYVPARSASRLEPARALRAQY